MKLRGLLPACLLAAGAASAQYGKPPGQARDFQPAGSVPAPLRDVGFDQKLGAQLPLDSAWRDSSGRELELGQLFGERPVLLAPVYYECPMLCTQVLNGVVRGLRGMDFEPGQEFELVAVSIDPGETPALAASKLKSYVAEYGRAETAPGWHFLTGDAMAIERLTGSIGFRYSYDARTGQYAHAAGIVLATPDGRVARYLFGIEYAPRDLKLGLVEASGGSIGSPVDKLLLYCFHYDPATGRYGAMTLNLVRLGGVVTLVALAGFVLLALRRERRASAIAGDH